MISNIYHESESLLCKSASAPTLSITLIVPMGKVLTGPTGPLELAWQVTGRIVFDLKDLALELPVFLVLLW